MLPVSTTYHPCFARSGLLVIQEQCGPSARTTFPLKKLCSNRRQSNLWLISDRSPTGLATARR